MLFFRNLLNEFTCFSTEPIMKSKLSTNFLEQFAHMASLSIVFGVLGTILSFLFNVFAARNFEPSQFGIYSLGMTILGFSSLIMTLGISQSITTFYPEYSFSKDKKHLRSAFLKFAFLSPFIISVIIGVLIFLFSDFLTAFFNYPPIFGDSLRIVAFILPLRAISKFTREMFAAKKLILLREMSYSFLEKFLMLIGLVFVIFSNLSIKWLIVNILVTLILVNIFDVFFLYKFRQPKIRKKTKISSYNYKTWILFSLPLFFSGVFSYSISWTDNLFIGKLLSPSDLGIYSVAYSFAVLLFFFMNIFSYIIVPLISESKAKGDLDQIKLLFKKSAAWVFGLSVPVFMLLALFSKNILSLFYGSNYVDGWLVILIITLGLLINIFFGFNTQILMIYKKTKSILFVNVFGACLNIVLNLFLIPLYGIVGAAIASSISFIVQAVSSYHFASRQISISFDTKFIMKSILSGLILANVVYFTRNYLLSYGVYGLIFTCFSFLIFYVVILFLLKAFSKEDMNILKSIFLNYINRLNFKKQKY